MQSAADPAAPTPVRTPGDGLVVGAQRNIALDFDVDEKALEGGGRAEGGASEAKGNASNEETNRESSSEKNTNGGGGGDNGSGDGFAPSPSAVSASLPRRTSNAEDILEESSVPGFSSAAELHEVRKTAWSFRPLTNRGSCLCRLLARRVRVQSPHALAAIVLLKSP